MLACAGLKSLARLTMAPMLPGSFLALARAIPARACGVSKAHKGLSENQKQEQQERQYLATWHSPHTRRLVALSETPCSTTHLQRSSAFAQQISNKLNKRTADHSLMQHVT